MHYYIYQITNLVNGKIYVGVHKTKNLDDGYMGSGKVIKTAIEKYGIENFRKDILEFFDTSDAMYAKEKEIVTEEFLAREDVYNLRKGGTGGFDYINQILSSEQRAAYGRLGYKPGITPIVSDHPDFIEMHQRGIKTRKDRKDDFSGKARMMALTAESKEKRRKTFTQIEHQSGEKNSQFGTRWIHNLELRVSKKIGKNEKLPPGWIDGRRMKF